MCGIVGYVGPSEAAPILVEGLRRLEYRGYDSAGLAVLNGEQRLASVKRAGKLAELEAAIGENMPRGHCGIAHTRWATHGPPNEENAHPHLSGGGDVAVVHNGIIENAAVLKDRLRDQGFTFQSDTDTEVVVHLIDASLEDGMPLEEAVAAALEQVVGAYGIAVISSRDPGKLVAARHGSPLLLGIGEKGEYLVGSDAAAVVSHTRDVVYLDDGDYATLDESGYRTYHLGRGAVRRSVHQVTWDIGAIERGGYDHFMLKEIFEQPTSLRDVMRGRLLEEEGTARLGGISRHEQELLAVDRIVITACGTSWHAALIGEYLLEEIARIPVEVEYASEFRYKNPVMDERTLVIVISQSGETADTLAALREAKRRGAKTMGIVNAVGVDDRARNRFRQLPPRRPGNRGRVHEGLHESASRVGPLYPVDGEAPGDLDHHGPSSGEGIAGDPGPGRGGAHPERLDPGASREPIRMPPTSSISVAASNFPSPSKGR